jgi:hypothetical protein
MKNFGQKVLKGTKKHTREFSRKKRTNHKIE